MEMREKDATTLGSSGGFC